MSPDAKATKRLRSDVEYEFHDPSAAELELWSEAERKASNAAKVSGNAETSETIPDTTGEAPGDSGDAPSSQHHVSTNSPTDTASFDAPR